MSSSSSAPASTASARSQPASEGGREPGGELRVIAASAGTGKTHRLADELLEALTPSADGGPPLAVPEGVIAVTYTRSAAAELEARVRRALVERGHVDLSRRLQNARIGTVHAVCTRLIEEHAFVLGLPPELAVLDKRSAEDAFALALASVVTDDERGRLDDLEQRLGDVDFDGHCRHLAGVARSNGIAGDALADSLRISQETLAANLPAPLTAAEIDGALREALTSSLARPLPTTAPSPVVERRARLQRASDMLARGEVPPWSEWLQLSGSRAVDEAARRHIHHPRLRDDLLALIELVFSVTRRAMARYREDKREQGVVDFVDMEELAHALVQRADVAEALRGDVQLLLVDEFQDTSPLQLSLFQALRRLTVRTVIVGDEKQSIFGFRHAEPALFRAVQAGASSRDVLDRSWRSRPGLVRAVSAIFAPAFATHGGLDEADVLLRAADPFDPPELGPCVERWWRDTSWPHSEERPRDEDVIAAGVAEIVSSRSLMIRGRPADDGSPTLTIARARDVAILTRTNAEARAVAAALARRDVRALLRRGGLSSTWEARTLCAGLALWLDGRDVLARASLVRLLNDPDGGTLLPTLVSRDDGGAFDDDEDVRAVVAAAAVDRTAGLVRAVDGIVDVLRLRERCARRGDARQRLADLAALRALAVRFVDVAFARGHGPTIPGFLARLDELRDDEDDEDDERGDVAGGDAVTVMTWHKSKGREWPIVVLTGLWKSPWVRTFDTVVDTTVSLKDPAAPLFGRHLRFWPSPYGNARKGGLFDHLKQSPAIARAERAAREESLRLLYVGFTRARDRVVVVGDHTVWEKGMFSPLSDERGPFCREPLGKGPKAAWGPRGSTVDFDVALHVPSPHARAPRVGVDVALPPTPAGPRPTFAPMFSQPSATTGEGRAGERITIGPRVEPRDVRDELIDLNHLGQALHAFFAVDAFVGEDDARRHALAERVRRGFDVERLLSGDEVVALGTKLWASLDTRWPSHRRRTEVPVLHKNDAGSVVRGQIDLLLDRDGVDGAAVIVDHKTTLQDDVGSYAGQLRAYRDVVERSGLRVGGTWIHLPLLGLLVEVVLDDGT
jgi:ATP-dependent exoDNAse (exonuclease V) beta subunit